MAILDADPQAINWGAVLIQGLITLGVVFGGAGFWDLVKTKFLTKHSDKKEEKNYDTKFDELSDQFTDLNTTVRSMSDDLKEIKQDIALLQAANDATVKYRETRDKQDQINAVRQTAVIKSLRGMIRDRLLEAYERCMEKGYYTKEERETYGKLFECYEEEPFNGNGVMHQLQPKMQALPWTAEEAELLVDKRPVNR